MRPARISDSTLDHYAAVRYMPDGSVAGIMAFIYTTGLCVGITDIGYERRFCYARHIDALEALLAWDGTADPPGPWIKEKGGELGDRANPNTLAGIPIVADPLVPDGVTEVRVGGEHVGSITDIGKTKHE